MKSRKGSLSPLSIFRSVRGHHVEQSPLDLGGQGCKEALKKSLSIFSGNPLAVRPIPTALFLDFLFRVICMKTGSIMQSWPACSLSTFVELLVFFVGLPSRYDPGLQISSLHLPARENLSLGEFHWKESCLQFRAGG